MKFSWILLSLIYWLEAVANKNAPASDGGDKHHLSLERRSKLSPRVSPYSEELDILLRPIQQTKETLMAKNAVSHSYYLEEGDMALLDYLGRKSSGRNAIRDVSKRWPDGVVPYELDNRYTEEKKEVIRGAMREYHEKTCVRFVPREPKHEDFVYVYPGGSSCSSFVGRQGTGKQEMSLGKDCVTHGITLHELMHVLGFEHEQSRTDRDEYVDIFWENIREAERHNFDKYSTGIVDHLGESYDACSVMHYDTAAFAKDKKKPTIRKKETFKTDCVIGQRKELSPVDVRKINKLYKCSEEVCSNVHDKCQYWGNHQWCQKNPRRMLADCPSTCLARCEHLSKATCSDVREECKIWAEMGECWENPNYMLSHCTASCNMCGKIGWMKSAGYRYYFSSDAKSFYDAKAKCEDLGAKLVEPKNKEDIDRLRSFLTSQEGYWTGIKWNPQKRLQFMSNNRKKNSAETCVQIRSDGRRNVNDDCSKKLHYICEH